jgi:hypothetical protein
MLLLCSRVGTATICCCAAAAAAVPSAGEAIKALINEEFGDGIMSAIGFYATVDKMTGNEGEARVVITFNGERAAQQHGSDGPSLPF